ncbi:hypothetical protein B7P43_G09190 [Cryptotermes secundus]|uniref:Endonuclease/exonuclease/phosphatase domain-containing protein n=1 Tax=Cryptotermes secundus TaxID=105785 RepID=A0A2J7QGW5_9NEOP|nr:hypothetical protein B7P43_G09190 [Cryptotermes secundus]
MLIDFCERNGLIVTNTWFKKPKRRIYTWKAPGDWRRHQLDYILVKHRFRNSVKDVKNLPGADIDSDHNLLVAKFRTRLKKIIRFQKCRPRWDLEKLYAQRQSVQETLEEKLGAIEGESGNAEVQWNNIKECMLDTISDLLGKFEKIARKPWVTQEMMSKMEEGRKWKNVNNEEGRRKYRRLRNELKRATDWAKKECLEQSGFISQQGEWILLFFIMFRPALEPRQPPVHWVWRAGSLRVVAVTVFRKAIEPEEKECEKSLEVVSAQ